MKSSTLFSSGVGALIGSFAAPPLSLPLQAAALGLFIASELTFRYEDRFVNPVKERKHKAWLDVLDHAFEYQTGAAQAHASNQVDWRYRQRSNRLNLTGSTREKYLTLFTQGSPAVAAAPVRTVDVGADPQAVQPDRPSEVTRIERPHRPHLSVVARSDRSDRSEQTAQADEEIPLLRLENFLKTPFVLIWGCQGSGKTTLAKRLARLREEAGHEVRVADPHGSSLEWGDWEIIGEARNFKALNKFLHDYDEGITDDYHLYSQGERDFPYQTLLVDEFTQWSDRCQNSPGFVKSICSDIRKISRCVILISHSDTLTGLGNASGLRASIDRSAVKIELEAEIDEHSGEYVATGFGWLQYPGKEKVRVRIPYDA